MEIVTKIAPIILALIMLGLGLGLKLEDFGRVLKTPKDFIVGFISQLIILPIVAYVLILIFRAPPEIAIGVMIIAAAPGGVTSNIMTKFADGDVALSISLTAIISLLSIITVPLIIFTSAGLLGITEMSQNISMTGIALKMFLVVTVPVILGMIIRKVAENFIASKVGIFNKLNIVLFLIFFFAAFYEEKENSIHATVNNASFVGSSYQYILNSDAGKLFVISGETNDIFKVGEEVFLSINDQDVKILND